MKLKLNIGEKPPQEQGQNESWSSYINRNILTPAARSLAAPMGGIPNQNYAEQLGERYAPGIIEKTGGSPKGLASTEAPNIIPGTLASLARPLQQAVSGGATLAQAGKSLFGSVVGSEALGGVARFAGAPEKVQRGAEILGSIGGGAYARQFGLSKPSTVLSKQAFEKSKVEAPKKIANLKERQGRLYNQIEKQYSNLKVPAKNLADELTNLEKKVDIGVDQVDQKVIFETMNQLKNLIKHGKINVSDAIDFVQRRNKAVYDQTMKPNVQHFNKEMIDLVNSFIKNDVAKHNPTFGKAYQKAKDLTTELKGFQEEYKGREDLTWGQYRKELAKMTLEEIASDVYNLAKGQLLPSAASAIVGYFGGGLKAGGIARAGIAAGQKLATEFSDIKSILKSNPGLGKDFLKLESALAQRDKPLAISAINRINERFKKQEKKVASKIKGKIKFR